MRSHLRMRRALIVVVALLGLFAAGGSDANVIYTYDPAGRVTTAVYDNGACVAYSYDAASNRTSQTNTVGGAPVMATWGTGTWGCFAWTAH